MPRKVVLVVDDDAGVRESLAALLEDSGYAVLTATGGEQALFAARGSPTRPSLILLDLVMPGMDGWAFRAAQLADEELKAIPVIVMSARSNMQRQPISADAVFYKPFMPGELLAAVQKLCPPGK